MFCLLFTASHTNAGLPEEGLSPEQTLRGISSLSDITKGRVYVSAQTSPASDDQAGKVKTGRFSSVGSHWQATPMEGKWGGGAKTWNDAETWTAV